MFASIVGWLISKATGEAFHKAVAFLSKTDDGAVKLAQIKADLEKTTIEAKTERQASKLNWPVFWLIIVAMMGPPILMLWSIFFYNVFWWQDGLWPQTWAIAEFPPSVKPWVEKSIDWLYDPLGAPIGVGSALTAGYVTRKR